MPSSFCSCFFTLFLSSNPTSPLSATHNPAAWEPRDLIPQPSPEGTYLSSPRPEAVLLHCGWLKKKKSKNNNNKKISFPYLLGIPHIKGDRKRESPIDPLTGGDGPLGRYPSSPIFQAPKTRIKQKSRSQEPTLLNKLEADYTGTQPGDGPRRAGCTCGPSALPPGAEGGAQGSLPFPAPTREHPARPTRSGTEADGEAFLQKFKGSSRRLRANQARQQTPTSGRTQSRRDRQSPPLRSRAHGGRGGSAAAGTRPAQGPKRNNVPVRGGGLDRVPRHGIPKPSGVPDRSSGGSPCSPAAPRAERPDACAPRGHSTCALPARVDRRTPTFAGSPGRACGSLGRGGRRRHHLRRAAAAPGRAPEARGALDPESAAPPAAATSKRGGGAGAPRAAAAAATGAAAHDSVTRGIRQSVTWTPGPCRRRSSGTNRSLRAPRLAGSQPMGRARASM